MLQLVDHHRDLAARLERERDGLAGHETDRQVELRRNRRNPLLLIPLLVQKSLPFDELQSSNTRLIST